MPSQALPVYCVDNGHHEPCNQTSDSLFATDSGVSVSSFIGEWSLVSESELVDRGSVSSLSILLMGVRGGALKGDPMAPSSLTADPGLLSGLGVARGVAPRAWTSVAMPAFLAIL
jgi:hypothetical protein